MRLQIAFSALLTLSFLGTLCLPDAVQAGSKAPFRAGFASATITPLLPQDGATYPVFIAGYGHPRIAESVHDDLYCRALALDDGHTRLVIVSCDVIGLLNQDVQDIRRTLHGIPPTNVIICATHTHSGPDTIGLWGPSEDRTGVDPDYMVGLKACVKACITEALKRLRPATLSFATTKQPDGVAHNARDAGLMDAEIRVMEVSDAAGKPLATLVNWGCHPEVLTTDSKALSCDWVYYLREEVEKPHGGKVIFLNGALGGMVTPTVSESTFAEAERVGRTVGRQVLEALPNASPVQNPALDVRSTAVALNLANKRYELAANFGVIPAAGGMIAAAKTEISLVTVRSQDDPASAAPVAQFATFPGEPLPAVGLAAKALLTAKHRFIVGLADDELGYILPREYVGNPTYDYEWSMSVGPDTAPSLLQGLKGLLSAGSVR